MTCPTLSPLRTLSAAGFLALAGCAPGAVPAERAAPESPVPPITRAAELRPNVILVLADDLGYGDLRSYNPDSKVPTPRADALAAEGMRFTDAHTSSAVCTPSRYSVLTGRYAWRTRLKRGAFWGYAPALIEPERRTVADAFQAEGYRTGGFGKWHLGLGTADSTDYAATFSPGPLDYGFDEWFGVPVSLDMHPYVYVEGNRSEAAPTEWMEESKPIRDGGGGFWRAGPAAPGFRHADVLPRTTARALDFIEAGDERPFFLYLALTSPHTPWTVSPDYESASQAGPYGDFVAETDAVLGQVLDALERTGQADNTLVLFASDNGAWWREQDEAQFDHLANGTWRGQKADVWEGGHRVPLIARWPGHIPAGRVTSAGVELTDLYATFSDVLGAALPDGAAEDSFSFWPTLQGERVEGRPFMIHHSGQGVFAIREGRWKYIEGADGGGFIDRNAPTDPALPPVQLYDMERDPAESDNVYAQHPDVVARLAALLERQRTADHTRPTPAP